MCRYVAFLRGVSPMSAKSAELKCAFEAAGFTNVRTVLSSGNVAFDAACLAEEALEQQAEAAMRETLGRSFFTIVRTSKYLNGLLARDLYRDFDFPPQAKRIVSFLRTPCSPRVPLPLAAEDASVLGIVDREVYSAYSPHPKGPVFMLLIEKAFGTSITTRTWETVKRCAIA